MKKHPDYKNLYLIDHPIVQDRLSFIRRKETPFSDFRRILKDIAMLMTYDVVRDLPMTTEKIETPMTVMDAPVLAKPQPVIIPILRAGLGLSEGAKEVLTEAVFGHIGVYRDEKTHRPVEYLVKLPKEVTERDVLLVDPMLATGFSAKFALDKLIERGVKPRNIKFIVLVAAPEGVQMLQEAYPDIPIYTAALDECLNDDAFIIPGLGDAGDRICGTF